MRGLFITHDVGDYGASRSLQLLLRNMPDLEVDMVIRPGSSAHDVIRRKFGNVRNIYECPLPWDKCYESQDDGIQPGTVPVVHGQSGILRRLRRLASRGREWMRPRMPYTIMARNAYDFIHLNSLVLHPLIRRRFPFVIHIREIYDGSNPEVFASLQRARGVIFIDESTRRPFEHLRLGNWTMANNPFDMTAIGGYADADVSVGFNHHEVTVFSMVGQLTAFKGTDFVIKAFSQLRNPNIRLLIVGPLSTRFADMCQHLTADPRIIFWGHEADIFRIYYLSDCIVRGEPQQCIGRTVFEGLYAGCQVVVPGNRDYGEYSNEFGAFAEALHYYPPRDEKQFVELLEKLATKKVGPKRGEANVNDAVAEFRTFVTEVVRT